MSARLILICHASTAAVRTASFPVDEPLEPQGQAKASALAGAHPPELRRVDAAWTSPALRARQTAAALHLTATVDHMLGDIDLGRWAGRSLAEFRQPIRMRSPRGSANLMRRHMAGSPWMPCWRALHPGSMRAGKRMDASLPSPMRQCYERPSCLVSERPRRRSGGSISDLCAGSAFKPTPPVGHCGPCDPDRQLRSLRP